MEESARIYVSPTENLHKRVMRYYKPFLKGEFIKLSIHLGCLVLGYAMLFIVYAFSAIIPEAVGAAACILILIAVGFRFVRYILLMFYSDFALMVVLIVDFLLNVIVLIIQYSTIGFIPLFATQIIVAAGLLLNAAFTLYSYMDSLALHRRLTKMKYVVAEGVVCAEAEDAVIDDEKSPFISSLNMAIPSDGDDSVSKSPPNKPSVSSIFIQITNIKEDESRQTIHPLFTISLLALISE